MKINGERDLTDSPCIGICSSTTIGDAICIGCGRLAEEVIEWNTYTDERKIAINLRILTENKKGK